MRKPFTPLKVKAWPELDRRLWLDAQEGNDPFSIVGFAADWSPSTIRGCERGYGVYLNWLQEGGLLTEAAHPCDRVNEALIVDFLADYGPGRAEATVAGTLRGIAYVLRASRPPDGVKALTRLAHRLANSAKPARPKLPRMAPVEDLASLGHRLMEEGRVRIRDGLGKTTGAPLFRDGLIIASLAWRPLRRGEMFSLRLGHTLLFETDAYRVSLTRTDRKAGKDLSFLLPDWLTPSMDEYLDTVRPVLLRGKTDEGWLWLSRRGGRLALQDISIRVGKLTLEHLGRRISPHLFRDCLATTISQEAPEDVGLTKDAFGHATLATSQKYYNQAKGYIASDRHAEVLRDLRALVRKERK